jgi:dienelactone hydrolase
LIRPYAKKRTEQLAKLGYVALAINMYGKGIRPQNPKKSVAQAVIYRQDRKLTCDRTTARLQVLQQNTLADLKRIAAIGYCFGDGTVLELALTGAGIAGVVSFHGNLDTPNASDAKNIKAKVLVLHRAKDPFVPKEQVKVFKTEMQQAKVNWQLVSYPGAVHSFTNPESRNDSSKGAAYNKDANERSWRA